MAVSNSLVVVVQNEPRDGDIVYLEQSLEDFKQRVVDTGMEPESGSEVIELEQTYYDENMMSTIKGYSVQLPFEVTVTCADCFFESDQELPPHREQESLVINFVTKTNCESCKEKEE
jgi:hypothetical protein